MKLYRKSLIGSPVSYETVGGGALLFMDREEVLADNNICVEYGSLRDNERVAVYTDLCGDNNYCYVCLELITDEQDVGMIVIKSAVVETKFLGIDWLPVTLVTLLLQLTDIAPFRIRIDDKEMYLDYTTFNDCARQICVFVNGINNVEKEWQ